MDHTEKIAVLQSVSRILKRALRKCFARLGDKVSVWEEIDNIEAAKSYILCDGQQMPKSFEPDDFLRPFIEDLPIKHHRLLDFGCGLGRSFEFYYSLGFEAVGFDLPNMIQLAREYNAKDWFFYDDWRDVQQLEYDFIVATLTLQHLDESSLQFYLQDFKYITDYLILHTRTWSDYFNDLSVLEYVINCGWELIPSCGKKLCVWPGEDHRTSVLVPYNRLSKNT